MSRKDPLPAFETTTGPKAEKTRKVYDRLRQQWSPIHEQIDADYKCISLEGPWPEKERKIRESPGNERPCLHEDVISQFNNTVANDLEMNPMGIEVQPEGETANEKTAEEIEDRIRQIEYEQNGQHSYLTAGRSAVDCGFGAWYLDTDWVNPFSWDRQILIRSIQDPKSILVTLNHKKPDWSDIEDAIQLSRISHEDFKRKYPNAEIQDFEGFIHREGYTDWVDNKEVQIAKHWYVDKVKQSLLLLDDGTPEGWSVIERDGKIFDAQDPDNPLELAHLKRKKKTVTVNTDAFQDLGIENGHSYEIMKESKRFANTVKVRLTNGIEVLEETEWEDEEIPVFIVTGRVKYENSKVVIESQTRKARTGQLLYDLCISSIQEETARVPKFIWLGIEGQFDTTTDWRRAHREPAAMGEYKAITEEAGSPENPLPAPQMVRGEAQIQSLLELKQSLLIGIQNALGISSTERKDRAAKSGKALEQLEQDMNVGTYHYHSALRMAQVRQYRAINRLLPRVENTPRQVGFRDSKGNYRTKGIPADYFADLGKHQVVIDSAKYYQSLQEEQSDFAESLLNGVKDPTIMLAVLPDLIRMKGLGERGDDLAKMIEAMQPPQMQQAREGNNGQISPAMVQAMSQQAQMTVKALNAQLVEVEKERDLLLFEKKSEQAKTAAETAQNDANNKTKVDVALINASVKERMDSLDQQVMSIRHIADMLIDKFALDHEAMQNDLDRQHEQSLAASQAAAQAQAQQTQIQADQQAQPAGAQ